MKSKHSYLLLIAASVAGIAALAAAQDQPNSSLRAPRGRGQRGQEQRELVGNIRNVGAAVQESFPPNLVISVSAIIPSAGYTNVRLERAEYDTPPADGIQDYYLYATPPRGASAQVLTEVRATDTWSGYTRTAPWLRGVRIHGEGDGVMVLQVGGGQPNPRPPVAREFVGASRRGSLAEALDDALGKVGAALGEGGVADGMAEWELKTVSGRVGGFAGFNELSVTIAVRRSPDWRGE
jgi:hypothetical protein